MSVHEEVLKKLEELLDVVKDLPQGYQYKVRELSACIETVVSMYDDVQRGIIPEVLVKMSEGTLPETEETPKEIVEDTLTTSESVLDEPKKTKLAVRDINL